MVSTGGIRQGFDVLGVQNDNVVQKGTLPCINGIVLKIMYTHLYDSSEQQSTSVNIPQ